VDGEDPVRSPANEIVRTLRRLSRHRDPGRVLLEGRRVIADAAQGGIELELLALREGVEFDLSQPSPARVVSERAFAAVRTTVSSQGVLAIARHRDRSPREALNVARASGWPLIVLDGVQDPGNVGTICRSAAAAGAPAVAVLDGSADPFGPKAVRASAGAVFRLCVAQARWQDLAGVQGYGAAATGGVAPDGIELARAGLVAFGSEAHGLRRGDLEPVTIPMAAGVESLNVAAAAAVVLFEIRRKMAA
jgi:RNA methyltransferase, TrmH family